MTTKNKVSASYQWDTLYIGVGIRTCVFVLKILCQRSDKKIASLKQKMPPSMQQCVRFFLNHCS